MSVKGDFEQGDAVSIVDSAGKTIARGLVNYSSDDMEKIKGLKTPQIRDVLGDEIYEEAVHRDDMIVF